MSKKRIFFKPATLKNIKEIAENEEEFGARNEEDYWTSLAGRLGLDQMVLITKKLKKSVDNARQLYKSKNGIEKMKYKIKSSNRDNNNNSSSNNNNNSNSNTSASSSSNNNDNSNNNTSAGSSTSAVKCQKDLEIGKLELVHKGSYRA